MSLKSPESYNRGLEHLEKMALPEMCTWLEDELKDKRHVLAGQADDQPVQAIVNHAAYLTAKATRLLAESVSQLISDWRENPKQWNEQSVRALLNLAARLTVNEAKAKLQTLALDTIASAQLDSKLFPAVLRTLAALSGAGDRVLWNEIAQLRPPFAGLAFQVLARIAPADAKQLLSRLPNEPSAVASVARKLPDFVSKIQLGERQSFLIELAQKLRGSPKEIGYPLLLALSEAGFEIPEDRSIAAATWQPTQIKSVFAKLGLTPEKANARLGAAIWPSVSIPHFADREALQPV